MYCWSRIRVGVGVLKRTGPYKWLFKVRNTLYTSPLGWGRLNRSRKALPLAGAFTVCSVSADASCKLNSGIWFRLGRLICHIVVEWYCLQNINWRNTALSLENYHTFRDKVTLCESTSGQESKETGRWRDGVCCRLGILTSPWSLVRTDWHLTAGVPDNGSPCWPGNSAISVTWWRYFRLQSLLLFFPPWNSSVLLCLILLALHTWHPATLIIVIKYPSSPFL